jgi:uncharacterized membrane protein
MNPLKTTTGTIVAGVVLTVAIGLVNGVDFSDLTFLVWIHVFAGIIWIGLLYYFNFVQVPALAAAAADTGGPGGSGISKYVAPRALAWFRWGAVVTWLSGAAALLRYGIFDDAFMLGLNENAPGNAWVIGVGAWLGTIMLLNVWGLIWPNQKKVLGLVEATADEINKARRTAFLASRINTMLSVPMLASMVGYGHTGFFI